MRSDWSVKSQTKCASASRISASRKVMGSQPHQNVTLLQGAMPVRPGLASMDAAAPRQCMESENRQLSHVRDRLRMLLGTHLSGLDHKILKPAIGDVVIQQDTPAESVLLVQAGALRVERTEPEGTPQLIAIVGPDELVGEMALIGDQHHSATVTVCHGPAELLAVRSDDLLQAAIYDSDLVMELLALSSTRCRQTNRHLALILEALDALIRRDANTLTRCCSELDSGPDQVLSGAAERLRRLAQAPKKP